MGTTVFLAAFISTLRVSLQRQDMVIYQWYSSRLCDDISSALHRNGPRMACLYFL